MNKVFYERFVSTKIIGIFLIAVLGAVFTFYITSANYETTPSNQTPYFKVAIQQSGKVMPIKDHVVQIKKKPFTLVIVFPSPQGILVNSSFDPESYDAARAGKSFSEIPGFLEFGMAEDQFNTNKDLILTKTAPQYLYYESDDDSRFDQVLHKNNAILAGRMVKFLSVSDEEGNLKKTPISKAKSNAIYMVFADTRWNDDYTEQTELHRDFLKIEFKK